MNDNGRIMRRGFLDGYPYSFYKGQADNRAYWFRTELWPTGVPGELMIFGGKQVAENAHVTIDELRVSKVPRYPFGNVSERTFVPATKPFTADDHTLILHHFEDQTDAQSAHDATVKCTFAGF